MKRNLYTAFDNGRIVEALIGGKKPRNISEEFGYPIRTLNDKYLKFLERGDLNPLRRSGRPKITTERERNMICRVSIRDPFLPAREIKEDIGRKDVSTRTISRILVTH